MVVNAIFTDVKIYNVQDRLDVVVGQEFLIEILEALPDDFDVFTNKDPVLIIGDDSRTVTADKLGVSKIRFMSGTTVIKDLWIYVVSATHPAATILNGSLGQPVEK